MANKPYDFHFIGVEGYCARCGRSTDTAGNCPCSPSSGTWIFQPVFNITDPLVTISGVAKTEPAPKCDCRAGMSPVRKAGSIVGWRCLQCWPLENN